MCGVCDKDPTNNCVQDCRGIWGGDSVLDCVGKCDGKYSPPCYIADYDGNVYEYIPIGDQLWITENLKVTHYNNGDKIPRIRTAKVKWCCEEEGKFGWQKTYENSYNWYAVNDDRGLCPAGFHVPSDDEYAVLIDYLNGSDIAGGRMKKEGIERGNDRNWSDPNTGATNKSGFTALPGGFMSYYNGTNQRMGQWGFFWSSTEDGSYNAWSRDLFYITSEVFRNSDSKHRGLSVRCIGDTPN